MTQAEEFQFQDMQALLRYAHGQLTDTCFLLLRIRDPGAASAWLSSAPVTNATELDAPPQTALQIAFTAGGLEQLGVPEKVMEGFALDFRSSMIEPSRARRFGDTDSNDPRHWYWGGNEDNLPHVLLMLYAQPGQLGDWKTALLDARYEAAFSLSYELPTSRLGPRESFGFVDGISQPVLDWGNDLDTDIHRRERYSDAVKVGEIVLGYHNEYGEFTDRPLLSENHHPRAAGLPPALDHPDLRDLGRNGSYLVLRQLAQDIPGFWTFVNDQAGSDPQQREQLAAKLVGRARDGAPLIQSPDDESLNRFTFDSDPDGVQCPYGAHIRRANPRTGDFPPQVSGFFSRLISILGFGRRHIYDDLIASTRFHRLLRRGRSYGDPVAPEDAVGSSQAGHEHGLQFICLVANITRQFEFVQTAWIMSPKFAGVQNESDPLLGNREPTFNGDATDQFRIPDADGAARCLKGLPQFVTVKGGAYFFLPGLAALRYIAGCAAATEEAKA